MNILTATDDNYAPWCGVMLTSLIKENPGCNIHVYLLCDGVSDANKKALQTLNIHFHMIDLDWSNFETWVPPMIGSNYLSRTTWARLGLTDLLPKDIDKILHIDADTLILGSLKELYEVNIQDVAAAVVDEYRDGSYINVYGKYFNAGVMLINVDYFRKNNIKQKCIDFLSTYGSIIRFHDQDTLNKVLDGKVKYVSRKYNLTSSGIIRHGILDTMRGDVTFEDDEKVLHDTDVRIVHFTGSQKPWRSYMFRPNPYVSLWRKVWRESEWRTIPLQPMCTRLIEKMIVISKNILFKMRLIKCPIHYRVEAYPNTFINQVKSFFLYDSYR